MIEEIKKALSGITQGEWKVNDLDMCYSNEVFVNPSEFVYREIAGGMTMEDATFIGNSPKWIRYLIGEVERWQDEALTQAKLYTQKNILCHELRERVVELQRELSEYREEEDRPRLKMDAHGNLTLIEEE